MNKNINSISIFRYIAVFFFIAPLFAFASPTDGTILIPDQYAWGENVAWVNFAAQNGNVHITDTGLTGYIWDSIYGWINLKPLFAGVTNDGQGHLSGMAWSAGTGFIDFTGVTINTSGKFTGSAQGILFGRLNFDCANCSVITDYRPQSARATPGGSGGEGGIPPYVPPFVPTPPINTSPIGSSTIVLPPAVITEINHQNASTTISTPLTSRPLTEFELLLANFPTLKTILGQLGVNVNKEDEALKKITGITFVLPNFLNNSIAFLNNLGIHLPGSPKPLQNGLSGQNVPGAGLTLQTGLSTQQINSGNPLQNGLSAEDITKLKSLPLASLPVSIKQGIPEEVVFTRSGNANIDLPINLKVDQYGQLNKSIEITTNNNITLIVKPVASKRITSVIGYIVFDKSFSAAKPKPLSEAPAKNIFSSIINIAYAAEGLLPQAPQAENLMVLQQFEYTDPDHDGIFTANINTPYSQGEYQIVTVLNYTDQNSPKVLRLITVIDPEGYVYQAAGDNQTRIRNATVSMMRLNEATGKYELWNAKNFAQRNPQVTNQTGDYAFLVPEGTYKISVEASGYKTYVSETFTAQEGDSLHENIELIPIGIAIGYYWILITILVLILFYLIWRYIIKHNKNKKWNTTL